MGVISPPGVMETIVEVLIAVLAYVFEGLVIYEDTGDPTAIPAWTLELFGVIIAPPLIPEKDVSDEGISMILRGNSFVLVSLPKPTLLLLLSC